MGTLRRLSEAEAGRRLTYAAALSTKLQLPSTASVFLDRLTAPPPCTAARKLAASQRADRWPARERRTSSAEFPSKAEPLIATRPVLLFTLIAPPFGA